MIITSSTLKSFCYFFLIACTAFLSLHFFKIGQTHWFIWALFTLSLVSGQDFWQREKKIVIIGILLSLTVGLAGFLAAHTVWLAFYFFLATVICMFCGQVTNDYLSFFIINFFVLFAGAFKVNEAINRERMLMILAASLTVFLLQWIFAWRFARDEAQKNFLVLLRDLKELCEEIFSCLLQPAYEDNVYLFERRLHLQKTKVMASLNKITSALSFESVPQKKQSLQTLLNTAANLYAILLDVSELRWRITDYKTLGLCSGEVLAVMEEMKTLLTGWMKACAGRHLLPSTEALEQKIYQLEENYQHVLQVAAQEPLLFFLFIESLKIFSKEAAVFSETVETCLFRLT